MGSGSHDSQTDNLITILIVDDHAMVRTGLRMLLEGSSDLRIIGEAADGAAGFDLALRLKPRIVVTDIAMPPPDGIELARKLVTALPDTKTVILSFHEEQLMVRSAFAAGALGYVVKRSAESELENAIRAAAAGERYVDAIFRGLSW